MTLRYPVGARAPTGCWRPLNIMIWFCISTLGIVAAGIGCLYTAVAVLMVGRFARPHRLPDISAPSVTVLKPLHGDEPGLFENLASFCAQDYRGHVQVVFGVQDPADPAIAIVRRLQEAFPDRDLDLIVNGALHGSNRKISNLVNIVEAARHEVLVLADSDMRVGRGYLARLVAELDQPGVGAVTCLYHGITPSGLWSRLSALAVDTHFLPNVIMGVELGLARPCFGSTIALRRTTLEEIGGLRAFASVLADDYAIGAAVRKAGYGVVIPPFTVGHVSAEASASDLWQHELRWARTIKTVDPIGYAGSAITHAFPLALGAFLLGGGEPALIVAGAAIACRIALCMRVERAFGLGPHAYWLVPVRDLCSFAVFIASFLGDAVSWKGQAYRVAPEGALIPDRRSPP